MINIKHVVKTIGGSTISKRRGYNNKCRTLGRQAFPAVGDRFLSKLLPGSGPSDRRWSKGLNNNVLLEAIAFNNNNNNNNNNLRGGRPASTRVASPYGGPVITGKPGIWLALSCLGFSRSPLPALRRQASTCAWRARLRRR